MSFLSEVSNKELSSAGSCLRLGCPDIEKCIEPRDNTNNELPNGKDLDVNKPQSAKLESGSELETAPSSKHFGQFSALDQSDEAKSAQLQIPSHNVTQLKTEGVPLPLLHLHISPTPKIVILLQLKKENLRGPCKRLTRKTLKT